MRWRSNATMENTQAELLTDSEMARSLRVPVGWLREEAKSGRIPSVQAGRRYLFHAPTVEQALIERAKGGHA